jgi:hypothetical protein
MRHITQTVGAICLGVAVVSSAPMAANAFVAPDALTVPGDAAFMESIAATPAGDVFVSSIVSGAVLRFRPGSTTPETFVGAGVNAATAGLLVDTVRGVLWSCAVDLFFETSTALRAFDLETGAVRASYELPDRGVCADITLARGDVFVTDTSDPVHGTPGRILRLTTPWASQADAGTLAVWSADPLFSRQPSADPTFPLPIQINGIAFNGIASLYTANISSGELLRVDIRSDGTAAPARVIDLDRDLLAPDGIRMLDPHRLLVAELAGDRLTLVDVDTGRTTVVSQALDQPTSLIRVGGSLWVSEGQVLRLLRGQSPNLPFTIRRIDVETLPRL